MNYQRIYNEFIADRRGRETDLIASGEYFERHHITPRSLKGRDEPENIIALTAEDHLRAHIMLGRIHGGKLWAPVFYFFGSSNKIPTKLEIKAKALARTSGYLEYLSSDERREIISNGVKNSWDADDTRESRINGIKEQWKTADRKEKQSKALRGKKRPPHVGAAIAAAHKGKKRSEEHKAKLRKAWEKRRLVGFSVETRRRMSEAQKGKIRTSEHRAALSAAMKGKPRPDLTGANHGKAKAIRCVETGQMFPCISAAVRASALTKSQSGHFKEFANTDKLVNGYHWEYVD